MLSPSSIVGADKLLPASQIWLVTCFCTFLKLDLFFYISKGLQESTINKKDVTETVGGLKYLLFGFLLKIFADSYSVVRELLIVSWATQKTLHVAI